MKVPKKPIRSLLFPMLIAGLYLLAYFLAPDRTANALHKSGSVFKQIAVPLGMAFLLIVLLNRFLSPSVAVKYLGQRSGLSGIFLSTLAGIISIGPIYAWYPLLAATKEKGVSTFHVANFISCRSIKPVLLPILLAYFGWRYTTTFLLANLISALLVAGTVSAIHKKFPLR